MLGHVHDASGSTGVVFCAPWGFDALCTTKFHRLLAQQFADHGFPSIRFDYPGEGDSLPTDTGTTFGTWVEAAHRAAMALRQRTGCTRILYYGMGIGAAVALRAGQEDENVAGLILSAAALNGRRYLRELGLREKVIEDGAGIDFGYPPGATVLAAFTMAPDLADDLKQISIGLAPLPKDLPVLVLTRPEHAGDRQLAEDLREAGSVIECIEFSGYSAMLDGVVTSPIPTSLIDQVAHWVRAAFAQELVAPASLGAATEPARLATADFQETAEIIDGRLFGMLSRPACGTEKAVIVLLNMAYAPHIGWGGLWVETARTLASRGVAALRVDLSNIGESPLPVDVADQVVYSQTQLDDVRTVIRHMRSISTAPILLAGICSGAHSALYAGADNPEVAGIVSINQLRLVLDPEEDVESLLMAGARPLSDYKRRAFSLGTYKRIISGEVDLPNAARNIASHAKDRLSRGVSPYLGGLTKLGRLRGQLFRLLRRLEERRVPVTFISCRTDGSLDQQKLYFGKTLGGHRAFPGLRHILLENADHTLSPPAIRRQVIDILADAAEQSTNGR